MKRKLVAKCSLVRVFQIDSGALSMGEKLPEREALFSTVGCA
jgi:hypothetical protein